MPAPERAAEGRARRAALHEAAARQQAAPAAADAHRAAALQAQLDALAAQRAAAQQALADTAERFAAQSRELLDRVAAAQDRQQAAQAEQDALRQAEARAEREALAAERAHHDTLLAAQREAAQQLLADSGCIAISGGLEVASDRLLKLMKKGVSVELVARVTKAFADAGVLVHAYLMYGFPTQTTQDTVDALEYVRQLFEHGCIHSGFFHRFACTVHSPVGQNPAEYGVTLQPLPADARFARNDIAFVDPTPTDHDGLGQGLKKGLYNFMHGIGIDSDIRSWFPVRVPKTTVPRRFVAQALAGPPPPAAAAPPPPPPAARQRA